MDSDGETQFPEYEESASKKKRKKKHRKGKAQFASKLHSTLRMDQTVNYYNRVSGSSNQFWNYKPLCISM